MKHEDEFTTDFRKILIEQKGFPPESLILDYKISARSRADILVVERSNLLPLALIELKRQAMGNLESASKQIEYYLREIGRDIPAYLISFTDEGFRALRFNPVTQKVDTIDFSAEFPDYGSLAVGRATAESEKVERKKDETVDDFKNACYLLAGALSILLALTKAGLVKFTSEDMLLLAAIVTLCVIPHAAELKMLGVEYKAKTKKREQDDEKK